jgi:hypothetical protein
MRHAQLIAIAVHLIPLIDTDNSVRHRRRYNTDFERHRIITLRINKRAK